jgi:hypothetical protein
MAPELYEEERPRAGAAAEEAAETSASGAALDTSMDLLAGGSEAGADGGVGSDIVCPEVG